MLIRFPLYHSGCCVVDHDESYVEAGEDISDQDPPTVRARREDIESTTGVMSTLPRILVIDDMFGRQVRGRPNRERANLCGMYGLRDITGDEAVSSNEEVVTPTAEAVFFRGQRPLCAGVGDMVENDLDATISFVRSGWDKGEAARPTWALVLLDLCFYTGAVTPASDGAFAGMPEGRPGDDDSGRYFGLTILERLRVECPDLPVVVLSSKQREEVSRSFTAGGALGFISRTDTAGPARLREFLWRHGLTPDHSGGIVGTSLPLLLALRAARRAATDRRNVLIRGERGTGKDLMARYLSRSGEIDTNQPPFIVVDSGALAPSLWASELFGHVRGAFTGADRERQGRIVQADKGDLFLDEIGNMPTDVQTGLLRVIETREVVPLGASSGREVDVRFISATNEEIERRAELGAGFRADLLDRLVSGGTIWLPPLRERRSDIPLLVEKFIREAEAGRKGALVRQVAPEALAALVSYDWPGNVRELRSVVFDAVNSHADVEHLVVGHLRFRKDGSKGRNDDSAVPALRPVAFDPGTLADDGIPSDNDKVISLARPFIRRENPGELNGSFDRLVAGFHEQLADAVEACLAAYSDPRTGKINWTGAYRLAVPSAEHSSNIASDAKRWFRKLFEGKNGLIGPLPPEAVARRPLLQEAQRWACGSGL
ncbi:MAG: sigma 54-interacting transcriptional regulator [Proteobacteria bacterium]|nr:sigma 54-interacting transcriptional regulator [Pseudomonadota bacterium]